MLLDAAAQEEEALGLSTNFSDNIHGNSSWKEASIVRRYEQTPSPHVEDGHVPAAAKKSVPVDVDEDVRELENMLLGMHGGDDEGWVVEEERFRDRSSPLLVDGRTMTGEEPRTTGDKSFDDDNGRLLASSGAPARQERQGQDATEGVDGGGGGGGVGGGGGYVQAFSIEEDEGELVAATGSSTGSKSSSSSGFLTGPPAQDDPDKKHEDFEDTERLLGTVAESLTPGEPPHSAGDRADESSAKGHGLLATKSELALVRLMEEAREDVGDMLVDHVGRMPLEGGSDPGGLEVGKPPPGPVRKNSGFDDVLIEGSTVHGAASSPRAERGGGSGDSKAVSHKDSGGSDGSDSRHRPSPHASVEQAIGGGGGMGRRPAHAVEGPVALPGLTATGARRTPVQGSGQSRKDTHAAKVEPGVVGAAVEGSRSDADRKDGKQRAVPAVFSLGHDRWVTCGFLSGFVVDKAGPTSSVSMALRGAGSVLALDSLNYFLWR